MHSVEIRQVAASQALCLSSPFAPTVTGFASCSYRTSCTSTLVDIRALYHPRSSSNSLSSPPPAQHLSPAAPVI
ncbi:hypothetical protein HYDPIDRAFT_118578 [Hydnomerulius pinastri MD-312]|uniref:Uncharacterized protein n=1 Tax=Hydnomerulius pinastri MD-312 TaxID=994086 RepID=A0A0C9W8J3_9AGAM|nr:hypothetical protein HYDPIDRAFT_118578 [Hydnomerulius pinastri MD-312]